MYSNKPKERLMKWNSFLTTCGFTKPKRHEDLNTRIACILFNRELWFLFFLFAIYVVNFDILIIFRWFERCMFLWFRDYEIQLPWWCTLLWRFVILWFISTTSSQFFYSIRVAKHKKDGDFFNIYIYIYIHEICIYIYILFLILSYIFKYIYIYIWEILHKKY